MIQMPIERLPFPLSFHPMISNLIPDSGDSFPQGFVNSEEERKALKLYHMLSPKVYGQVEFSPFFL